MDKKKRSFSLRSIINNDKSLFVFVLILAVIIWTVTSLNIGTDESRTITVEVPIKLSDNLSKQMGMKYYTLQDSVELNITVTGAKYIIGQVSENDLNIKFDTSNVNRAGEQTIPILVTNKSKTKDFTVSSTYPSSLDAYFDVDETKTFDIQLVFDEKAVAEGYIFGTPMLSEEKAVISGPTTYVDKIRSVSADVDFGELEVLTESFNAEFPLTLNGSGIEQGYLNITTKGDNPEALKAVSVTIPVLKEATLPVEVALDNVPSGLGKKDYSVSYSVDELEAGVLESADVKSAVVGRIDFSNVSAGKNVFEFDITDTQGFTPLDGSPESVFVTVNVADTFEKKVIAVNKKDIKIKGGNGDEKVSSVSKSTVIIIAPKEDTVSASDISLTCDISEASDDNTYPIDISIKNDSAWVYSTYTATIE